MAVSDLLFLRVQHGSDDHPVSFFTFLPGILGEGLAGTEFMWPQVHMDLFGVEFTWSLLGYNVLYDEAGAVMIGGGLGYFISYEIGSFVGQCIYFPL